MHRAVASWAARLAAESPALLRVGYFGSYARGDWGVGSDVDLVLVVSRAEAPFWRRALAFDATDLPVPADVLVYTAEEWAKMRAEGRGPARAPVEWVLSRA